ncbi:MAG: cation:proton antiporter [bacterium]
MRKTAIYLLWILASTLAIYAVVRFGGRLAAPAALPQGLQTLAAALHSPLALLLIQAIVIIPLARLLGFLCTKVNQPMVLGEIVAGLLLGPSLLGWAAPGVYHFLFPEESLRGLHLLSQVGLIFFMFLVGLEFNPKMLRGKGEAAVAISHSSIIVPFLLGTLLALYLYPRLSHSGVRFSSFALFMGASMSVTAFPVLARILTERKLAGTKMGALVLTCAAIDDVTAWFLLALVISVVRATGLGEVARILVWTVLYLLAMIWLVRPLLKKLEKRYSTREGLSQNAVAIVFVVLMLSALTTEQIGIHALFGAFFLGAIMPNETGFVRHLSEKIEDIAVLFLLPLFFAYTGLRTQVGLLDSPELWSLAGLILAVACLGKFGGGFVTSLLMGLPWRESAAIGILMNTRGLMELVIISIGLDLGVISPVLFTMLVLMALITTFMTSPLLQWVYPAEKFLAAPVEPELRQERPYTVLVSVALLRSARGLIELGGALAGPVSASRLYALHLVRASDRPSHFVKGADPLEDTLLLNPLVEKAKGSGIEVRPLSFVTNEPAADIVEVARVKGADLILLGWHKPVLGQAVLGGTVHRVMEEAAATVGVFIDRGLSKIRSVLVPYLSSNHDRAALSLAQRLAKHTGTEVTILHLVHPLRDPKELRVGVEGEVAQVFVDAETKTRVRLKMIETRSPINSVLEESRQDYDLVLIGTSEELELEHRLFGLRPERIAMECPTSLLIVRQATGS